MQTRSYRVLSNIASKLHNLQVQRAVLISGHISVIDNSEPSNQDHTVRFLSHNMHNVRKSRASVMHRASHNLISS